MDKSNRYRQLIQELLTELTTVPYAYGQIDIETLFDVPNDRYMIADVG